MYKQYYNNLPARMFKHIQRNIQLIKQMLIKALQDIMTV